MKGDGSLEGILLVIIITLSGIIWYLIYEVCRLRSGRRERSRGEEEEEEAETEMDSTGSVPSSSPSFPSGPTGGRAFRKRDKFYFYGRRMVRKTVSRLSKRFLRYPSSDEEESPGDGGKGVGPAEEYLETEEEEDEEEEKKEGEEGERSSRFSSDLGFLLNGIRVFQYFDQYIFRELHSHLESVSVAANQYLYQPGERDESLYVVQSGSLRVYIKEENGSSSVIKIAHRGDSLSSLMSFIDVLRGKPAFFKTISARATVDSVVLKVPVSAFLHIFEENPEILIRIVQHIMARVQRVFLVALHQYLGLTKELIDDSVFRPRDKNTSEEHSLQDALNGFKKELNFDDIDFLKDKVSYRTLETGNCIMTEDFHNDAGLVYILSGSLMMSMKGETEFYKDKKLYTAHKGEIVGQLALLTGEANFYTAMARETTKIAMITKDVLFEILTQSPDMVLSLAHRTLTCLSPMVRRVDFALDWINIESGKVLYRQTDKTDCTYIVLSGRLRSFINSGDKKQMLNEYSRGDMVGLVDVVTSDNRYQTVMAVRDSELCKVPGQLLHLLKARYPVVVSKLISLLGQRLIGTWSKSPGQTVASQNTKINESKQFTTVALFPGSLAIPLSAFAYELTHALTIVGSVRHLSSNDIFERFGPTALDTNHEFRLTSWLGQQEDRHDVVVYKCDNNMTQWTLRCLRQADVIFDIVLASDSPEMTKREEDLEFTARRVRKELILVHDENVICPKGTKFWLKKRPWISSHFHLQAPKRFLTRKNEKRIADFYSRRMQVHVPNTNSDFSRLARHITGASIGLVLGGGGARGAAHIGMMKAIQEADIPVDKIGGVSIGCFIGGLWCTSRDISTVSQRARTYFNRLATRIFLPILDITYPYTSILSGSYFNYTLTETFEEDICIEDLWLPFFCVTTDITCSQERVHTKGIFWKYCRASMSYAWLLPPICDPVDGHLLMDGCYVNNVPGDIMARQQCKYILAIDVATLDDRNLYNYGDHLSGWWVLWKNKNPFSSKVKIPDQSEIQMRLAFCSHYKNLEELKNNPNYEYIQPPVDRYTPGNFNLFNEILEVGYHHGKTYFTGLRKACANPTTSEEEDAKDKFPCTSKSTDIPPWLPAQSDYTKQWARHRWCSRKDSRSSYTFRDLADMVCQNTKDGSDAGSSVLSRSNSNSGFRSRAGSNSSKRSRPRNLSGNATSRQSHRISPDDGGAII